MKKLRSGLYAILNFCETDSSDFRIAQYLIENIEKEQQFSIQSIADACFVSKSSVSRFCRRIGYEDYRAMLQSIHQVQRRTYKRFDEYLDMDAAQMTSAYLRQMEECIRDVQAYATDEILDSFAALLTQYKEIGIFGQMQSYAVALNFQSELASLGKRVTSFAMMSEQEDFILESGRDAMAIIVSCSGRYFQNFSRYFDYHTKDRPYLVLLTNNQRLQKCTPYDKVVIVPCKNNTASRPASLQLFSNLVVMRYARLLHDRQRRDPAIRPSS